MACRDFYLGLNDRFSNRVLFSRRHGAARGYVCYWPKAAVED